MQSRIPSSARLWRAMSPVCSEASWSSIGALDFFCFAAVASPPLPQALNATAAVRIARTPARRVLRIRPSMFEWSISRARAQGLDGLHGRGTQRGVRAGEQADDGTEQRRAERDP